MAAMTTIQLLHELRHVCYDSSLVDRLEERILDVDVLHVRVHLAQSDTFINVFYNLATDKTAFALVRDGRRIYGADNAKTGWHYHPFADPDQHVTCHEMSFSEFLRSVEIHLNP
ncbi:MAG: hypothetical protein WAW26_16765 [Anaerolineae bacterium]|uniref:hypothetical protein n=1 Tax=Candidatus Amarolinea dominans TaxID=3140696 RepID=UPI00313577E5|nr:hypothetical protein [Anaerolineae bacterium]